MKTYTYTLTTIKATVGSYPNFVSLILKGDNVYVGLLINLFEIRCLDSKKKSIANIIKKREKIIHMILTRRNQSYINLNYIHQYVLTTTKQNIN